MVAQIENTSGAVLKARSIIVATGKMAQHERSREDQYRTKGVTAPRRPLFKGKRVAVIAAVTPA